MEIYFDLVTDYMSMLKEEQYRMNNSWVYSYNLVFCQDPVKMRAWEYQDSEDRVKMR